MTNVQCSQKAYSRTAFEKEMVAQASALKGFARSIVRNQSETEDLVQETFTKALSAWESFEPGSSMKAWLFTILRNTHTGRMRRAWRNVPLDPTFAEVIQELCAIAPILASLPHEQRDAIVGARYVGMSYDELAVALDCALGTVKSRVSRAVDALEENMARQVIYEYDLSAWATASKKVPKDHPYFPIAKAYEEIFLFVRESSNIEVSETEKLSPKTEDLDVLWKQLEESGALESEEPLDRRMRR